MNSNIKFVFGIFLLLGLILISLSESEIKTNENNFLKISPLNYQLNQEQKINFGVVETFENKKDNTNNNINIRNDDNNELIENEIKEFKLKNLEEFFIGNNDYGKPVQSFIEKNNISEFGIKNSFSKRFFETEKIYSDISLTQYDNYENAKYSFEFLKKELKGKKLELENLIFENCFGVENVKEEIICIKEDLILEIKSENSLELFSKQSNKILKKLE